MGVAFAIVAGVVLIAAGAILAPRLRLPLQLLLVVVGVLVALIPGVPRIDLDPDVVLDGVLPPLLFAAAVQASLLDLRRTIVPVLALAVVPVVLTTLAVGFAVHAVLPAAGLAVALALGAAVGPPDAVATTSVGRSIGMPRRLIGLLEDESLLNDPVALVAQSVALLAVASVVTPLQVAGDLGLAVGAGVAAGVVVGLLANQVRKRILDVQLTTLVSFAVPYLAFLPAEALHGSGVLAVVLAGLIVAQQTPSTGTPRGRIAEAVNWRTVSFALENAVFLLIGLQLPTLIDNLRGRFPLSTVVAVSALVLVVVIATRFVFVFAAYGILRLTPVRHRFDARGATVIGWAGMRGVVTLAAAFLLPAAAGPTVPLLQLAAFVVVGGTLLLQGLTLGPLVRRLGLRSPDPASDVLQAAELMDRATAAASAKLDSLLTGDEPKELVDSLRARNAAQSTRVWELLGTRVTETPTAVYRRLRLAMLDTQRGAVLGARDSGETDDAVLRETLRRIDREESAVDADDSVDVDRDGDLVDPHQGVGNCEHLREAPLAVRPETPGECVDCVREGTRWVHLRTCLTCGHVGCCDSSERRHATAHFHTTEHPVMRSAEPSEAWRWCYIDERLG